MLLSGISNVRDDRDDAYLRRLPVTRLGDRLSEVVKNIVLNRKYCVSAVATHMTQDDLIWL